MDEKIIYVSGSTRNLPAIKSLNRTLALAGHRVMDWTRRLPSPGPDFGRRKNEDPGGQIFRASVNALAFSDLLIYLGPAGQDCGCELGMAHAIGIPVWGLKGKEEEAGLMVKGCITRWFDTEAELLKELANWRGWLAGNE